MVFRAQHFVVATFERIMLMYHNFSYFQYGKAYAIDSNNIATNEQQKKDYG